jgi:hypothetical protein
LFLKIKQDKVIEDGKEAKCQTKFLREGIKEEEWSVWSTGQANKFLAIEVLFGLNI